MLAVQPLMLTVQLFLLAVQPLLLSVQLSLRSLKPIQLAVLPLLNMSSLYTSHDPESILRRADEIVQVEAVQETGEAGQRAGEAGE